MNEKIKKLKDFGCDIDGAMERFLNDEGLYIVCFDKMLEDDNFEKLEKALKDNDIPKAFDYAHTLKGVFANMGATPLLNETVKIVEPLRAGKNDNLLIYFDKLTEYRNKLKEI